MAITKRTVQKITIETNGALQVKDFLIVEEDGVELSRSLPHSKVIDVEDDVTNESDKIKKLVTSLWTKEVRDSRRAEKEAQSNDQISERQIS